MQEVEHHYNLAMHLGHQEWVNNHLPDDYVKKVVKELLSIKGEIDFDSPEQNHLFPHQRHVDVSA